jgi:hypothetical protein
MKVRLPAGLRFEFRHVNEYIAHLYRIYSSGGDSHPGSWDGQNGRDASRDNSLILPNILSSKTQCLSDRQNHLPAENAAVSLGEKAPGEIGRQRSHLPKRTRKTQRRKPIFENV